MQITPQLNSNTTKRKQLKFRFVISPFTGEFGSLNWGLVQFLSCFASLLPRFFAFRALLRLLLFSCFVSNQLRRRSGCDRDLT